MGKYYCDIHPGRTCSERGLDGECKAGWYGKNCIHRHETPMIVPQKETVSGSNCGICEHGDVCGIKDQYKKALRDMYPAAAPCRHFITKDIFKL